MEGSKPTALDAIVGSVVHAIYEVAFVLLPVLVWIVILFSLDEPVEQITSLPVIPFATLALFSSMLRDGITAFHQDTQKDARGRDFLVTVALIGVTLSTVLLTLSVLTSKGHLAFLQRVFHHFTWPLFIAGLLFLFVTKSVLIQRRKYGRYV